MDEKLFRELSTFARANRKVLKPAEQWLDEDEFDDLGEAWDIAINELPIDWRKIVFMAWLASDEKLDDCEFEIDGFDLQKWLPEQVGFLVNVIFSGPYSTKEHPNAGRIRGALDKGRKVVKDEKVTSNIKPPLGEIATLIYEKLKTLPEHKAMTLPVIAQWLNDEHRINLDDTTIRTNHMPQLKPYGLYHKKRIGYCLREQ